MPDDCVDRIRRASGEALSDTEARDVLEEIERERTRLEQAGLIDGIEARLRRLAEENADRARVLAALQRKHAVLAAQARRRMNDAVLRRMRNGLGYRDAVLSVLEGDSRHRNSVAANILAFEATYIGGLMGRIAKDRPHVERRLRDPRLMEDATRIMFGEPVRNADPDAKYLADLFAEYMELARVQANARGANIGKLAGYVPQAHVDWRVMQTPKEEWVRFIRPLLDFERTFPDIDRGKIDDVLRSVYDTVTLGREPDWRSTDTFRGPRNFANALGQHRVLHFRDADAYMAYNQEFGFGNLFTVTQAHLRRMARTNAVMDKLGPNPGATLDNLLDSLIVRARGDEVLTQAQRSKIVGSLERARSGAETGRGGRIGAAFKTVSGMADAPADWTVAKGGQTFRQVQAMAKLGGATLTAVPTDLATLSMNLNFQGKPYWQAMQESLTNVFRGRGRGEDRAVSYLAGEGFDGVIGHLLARYGDLDTIPGRMARLMTHFFRWNFLSGWTDIARAAGARIMAADMGRLSGTAWTKLPERYRRVLEVHEIGRAEWDLIRRTAWNSEETGNRYVTADRVDEIDLGRFDGATDRERTLARDRLSLALRRFYADESIQNVIEVEASTERLTRFGTRPGTLGGEVARMLMQFKGFPIAFTSRILGRAFRGPGSRGEKVWFGAKLIATLAVAGYLSQVSKDFTRGLEPKDPTELDTIAQALLQSGAAGIYGDFLFNITGSRFGNTALETAAGPAVTTLADVVNIYQRTVAGDVTAKETFDSIWQNVPFQNLWYVRPAMDILVLNELREALSPGFERRRERFIEESFGQESLLPFSVWQ